MRLTLCAAAAALLLLLPAASHAANPSNVGTGQKPGVAVGADGTAYIAYMVDEGAEDKIGFCTLPRDASSCATSLTLNPTNNPDVARRPVVLLGPAAGDVRIIYGVSCCAQPPSPSSYMLKSTNGGTSFPTETTISDTTGAPMNRFGMATVQTVFSPGGALLSVGTGLFDGDGIFAQLTSSGPPMMRAGLNSSFPRVPDLVVNGTQAVVAGKNSTNSTWGWTSSSGPDFNATANWTSMTLGGPLTGRPRLAGGSAGMFLMTQRKVLLGGDDAQELQVQKFTGSGFDPAKPIATETQARCCADIIDNDLQEDGTGKLHAIWTRSACCDATSYVRYTTSADGGATWAAPKDLLRSVEPVDAELAIAPDGIGVAVWAEAGPVVKVVKTNDPFTTPDPADPNNPVATVSRR